MAPQLPGGDLERDPGAGRWPVEDHGECLACHRLVPATTLERLRSLQHAAQLDALDLAEVEEVPGHAALSRHAPSMMAQPSRISDSVMVRGGMTRATFSAAGMVTSPASCSFATN